MLKESDDLDVLGMVIESIIGLIGAVTAGCAFEKRLRSISRAASQRLGLLIKYRRSSIP